MIFGQWEETGESGRKPHAQGKQANSSKETQGQEKILQPFHRAATALWIREMGWTKERLCFMDKM